MKVESKPWLGIPEKVSNPAFAGLLFSEESNSLLKDGNENENLE